MSALLYSQLYFSGERLSQLIITVYVQIEIQQFFTLGVYLKKESPIYLFFFLILKEALETYLSVL